MSGAAAGSVRAQPVTFKAPVGGWNALNALDDMPAGDAVILDNWFPETSAVRLRRGSVVALDLGTGKPVHSLMDYGRSKLLAASGGQIIEASGRAPVSLGSGFTSDTWQHTNFATLGGQYAFLCNGRNTPQLYDGATLTPAAVASGSADIPLDVTKLVLPITHMSRIWAIEAATLRLWYLPTGAIAGGFQPFDLGPFCRLGGQLVGLASWTRENNSGALTNMLVAMTDQGEVLAYEGTDPAQAATFSLAGRFVVGAPVAGYRSMVNVGSDLVVMNHDGFQPLTNYLPVGEATAAQVALSRKIGNAVTAAVRQAGRWPGWDAMLYPAMNSLWFNVPQLDGTFQQFVQNTLTGAWCRFLGMPALCWRQFADRALFGAADGKVYQADLGFSDAGAPIVADCLPAYQYPFRGNQCQAHMARPVLQVSGPVSTSIEVQTDFQDMDGAQVTPSEVQSGVWGALVWGQGEWGGTEYLQREWVGVSALGYAISPRVRIETGSIAVQMNGIDVLIEKGLFL